MFCLPLLALTLGVAEPTWLTSYGEAEQLARKEKKDLLIYFHKGKSLDKVLEDRRLQPLLARHVCLRVSTTYRFQGKRLLDYSALRDMLGKPGLAVVSLHNAKLPFYREVVSVHPLTGSRYRWVPDYGVQQVKVILELPARASLTQRSMIYALRVHPERPQSVHSRLHPAFLGHARRHSARQASLRNQHHADIITASRALGAETGVAFGGASEVVAESWGAVVGGENVLEAAFSCIDAWRQSSGHWGAVVRKHRYYGYDLARGSNGTWYATGIFAD